MTVQCTCNKNKHKRYTVFIFFKSIQLIISPQWLWTSRLVDIFFEKLADRIKKRGVGFTWCSPSFEITKSYYMFLVFGIILKKLLFLYFKKNYYSWMYLERILKKNHEAYPHASTNKWQVGQTRGPVITGLRSISVTCAKLVLCLWNKNKILLFYGKFLYFQNWRNQGRKFRAPLKLTVVCKKLVLFLCTDFDMSFTSNLLITVPVKFCSPRINSGADYLEFK